MTIEEKDAVLSRYGIRCPLCGMALIDLEHDGYESGEPHSHDFYCTNCNIDITITTEE